MPLDSDKKIIAKNFSRAAISYDESASIQNLAAKELCAMVWKLTEERDVLNSCVALHKTRILDLGSGTSFVTKNLLQKFSSQNLEIFEIDLSLEMLQSWLRRSPNAFPIQADFEQIPFKGKSFDLLLSSFSLQWSSDFKKNFLHLSSILKSGGIFAFCIPLNRSLIELRTASKKSGCNFNFKKLPQIKDVDLDLKTAGFTKILFKQITLTETFPTAQKSLKSLKKIGANHHEQTKNQAQNFVTKAQLKKFNDFCLASSDNEHRAANSWVTTWDVGFFIVQSNIKLKSC